MRERGVAVGELLRWDGVPPMFTFDDPDGNRFYVVEDVVVTGGSGSRGGELPAGAVDVLAARVADRRRDARGPQALDELLLHAGPGRGPLGAGRRVERDRVDVYPSPAAGGQRSPSRSARQAWSLMSRISAYSIDTRRLVVSK